jgi:excisionase family DNA binding protein
MIKTIKEVEKLGWRVNEWAAAVGISRASVYELIAAKTIASVRFGGARIITTVPKDFLASLQDAA